MSDRGMKKWAPFASLIEQSTCLEKMRYEKNKIEKPSISSDLAAKINAILLNCVNQSMKVEYFYDGYIYHVTTVLKYVNKVRKTVVFEAGEIPMNAILDIDCENFSNNFDFF